MSLIRTEGRQIRGSRLSGLHRDTDREQLLDDVVVQLQILGGAPSLLRLVPLPDDGAKRTARVSVSPSVRDSWSVTATSQSR